MSTLGSIYKSMAGLLGFTKALDNLSHNVANMNTPGFKGRDVFFKELTGDQNYSGQYSGAGVQVQGSAVRFSQGDISQTSSNTDLAIDGNGFFVMRDQSNDVLLTRAGQFRFNEDGYLVDANSDYRVAALNSHGQLEDINFNTNSINQPVSTSFARLTGNLSSSVATGQTFPGESDDPFEIDVVDSLGATHKVKFEFTKEAGNQWSVQAKDSSNNPIDNAKVIQFSADGSPLSGFNDFDFLFQPYNTLTAVQVEEHFSATSEVAVTAGDINNATAFNLSVEGNRALAVRNGNIITFVDSGEFRFNSEGKLIHLGTGLRAAALSAEGVLEDFDIGDELVNPAEATSLVKMSGFLGGDVLENDTFPVDPVTNPMTFDVTDATGATHSLRMEFLKLSGDRWSAQVKDSSDANIGTAQTLRFNAGGQIDLADARFSVLFEPSAGVNQSLEFLLSASGTSTGVVLSAGTASSISDIDANGFAEGSISALQFDEEGKLQITYSNAQTITGQRIALVEDTGIPASTINISLGDAGGFSGVTGLSSTSNLAVGETNGRTVGQVTSIRFDNTGSLLINYSNGEQLASQRIALAHVQTPSLLVSAGDAVFRAPSHLDVSYGYAGDEGLGDINASSLELSNVELSREFADIIIIQRGYQASSQVLNVTNELLEELYNSTGK